MQIQFFCPRWGSEYLSWNIFLEKVKEAGYHGVEFGIPANTTEQELTDIWNLLEKHQLAAIPQHYDTVTIHFAQHEEQYAAWFEKIAPFPASKINSQTGRDLFTLQQNNALIQHAALYADKKGVEICHETHRGKFSFAAHVTAAYLREIPNLWLTLDISHWVCVAESLLDDQQQAVELALGRTLHLHARVGHTQGPQVTDPRAPEWEGALAKHLEWWDQLVAQYKIAQRETLTITTEFGPYPYLTHLPYTQQPIVSQWDINVYMKTLLEERYRYY